MEEAEADRKEKEDSIDWLRKEIREAMRNSRGHILVAAFFNTKKDDKKNFSLVSYGGKLSKEAIRGFVKTANQVARQVRSAAECSRDDTLPQENNHDQGRTH